MKTVKMKENANKKNKCSRPVLRRGFEKCKYGFLGNCRSRKCTVSAPAPQQQFGRPPTAGRKMAAILIHPNHFLLQRRPKVSLSMKIFSHMWEDLGQKFIMSASVCRSSNRNSRTPPPSHELCIYIQTRADIPGTEVCTPS